MTDSKPSSRSSYLLPANFPQHEPIFYIPQCPKITKVPEPRPGRRPPVAGYDMKTLRKQIDFLQTVRFHLPLACYMDLFVANLLVFLFLSNHTLSHTHERAQEVEEREATSNLLYKQNGELWQYATELADAHARNAASVKEQVHKLHVGLWRVHQERSALASKLELAHNSKELMTQISKDLKSAQLTAAEAERVRVEAEMVLSSARAENDVNQELLQRKVDTMQSLHWQLDESPFGSSSSSSYRHDEMESLERAEEFWTTSRAVLKSAYRRFCVGVGQRLRLGQIRRVLERVRCGHLTTQSMLLWRGYVRRRRFMHVMDVKRMVELLALVLGHWKVHAVVERLCRGSKRRRLLKRVFRAWASEARTERFDAWALTATQRFEQRRRLRRAFSGWEKLCIIKIWRNPRIEALVAAARLHLLRRIVRLWRGEARASSLALAALAATGLQIVLVRRALSGWKELCQAKWRHRGHLLKRFFANSRRAAHRRVSRNANRHNAIALWAWIKKRSFLRRWARRSFKHYRRRFSSSSGSSFSRRLGSYHNRRALLAGFQGLSFASAAHKRQRVCLKTAVAHCVNGAGRTLFRLWWFRARNAVRRRRQSRTELMLRVLDAWRYCLVPLEKRERRVAAAVQHLHDASVRRAVSSVYARWKGQARRQILLRTRRASLEARSAATLLRRGLSVWKGHWASLLFQRSRELTEDAARLHATGHLRRQENEELARELEALRRSGAEQERLLAELQERLVERDHAVRDAETTLEQRRRDKAALEEALQESRRLLVEAGEERNRMRAVEEALARDRAKDAAAMQQRKAEAERIIGRLVGESQALRSEAEAARLQAQAAEQQSEHDVAREEGVLKEALEAAAAMEGLVRQREGAVQQLRLEQQHLEGELERVQRRLDDFLKDGAALVDEDEAALRRRASGLHLLRADTGLAEARVVELRRILLDKKAQVVRQESQRVVLDEHRYDVMWVRLHPALPFSPFPYSPPPPFSLNRELVQLAEAEAAALQPSSLSLSLAPPPPPRGLGVGLVSPAAAAITSFSAATATGLDLSGSGTDSDPDTDEPSMSRATTTAGAGSGAGAVGRRGPFGLNVDDFDDLDDFDLEEDEVFHDDELLTKGNWSLAAHLKVQQLTDRIKRRLA